MVLDPAIDDSSASKTAHYCVIRNIYSLVCFGHKDYIFSFANKFNSIILSFILQSKLSFDTLCCIVYAITCFAMTIYYCQNNPSNIKKKRLRLAKRKI